MKAVYKYEVHPDDTFNIDLPVGAIPLSVIEQEYQVSLYCLVDLDQPKLETRKFMALPTGAYTNHNTKFIGTFQIKNEGLVFHLFEVI